MKSINWKVRAKNWHFWVQICLIAVSSMFMYAGVSGSDITTWSKLWNVIVSTFSNPYSLVMIVVAVYSAINDPTTKGFKDSNQALTYETPKED